MRSLVLDTNAIVKKLEQSGLTRTQAEAITEIVQDIDVSSLVTKLDLERALHRQTWGIVGALFAQGAFIIAILQYLQ